MNCYKSMSKNAQSSQVGILWVICILLSFHFGCARPSSGIPYTRYQDSWAIDNKENKKIPVYPYADNCFYKEATTKNLDPDSFYYSELLDLFGEEKLGLSGSYIEAYRVIWSRAFHDPVIAVFQRTDTEMIVRWKVLDGRGGEWPPGKIIASGEKYLTISDWAKLKQTVKNMEFWNLSSEDNNDIGVDGWNWLVEGRCENNYHLITRWAPEDTNGVEIGCINMLRQAEAKIPNTNID